jgi:hypothetical protein
MMIGSLSGISYVNFAAALAPVAVFGLIVTVILIALLHRREFSGGTELTAPSVPARVHRFLLWRALAATLLVVALFFAGKPPAKVAIIVGGLLLLTRRVRSERVYAQIDWSLLLMFAGLFIIVAGAERSLFSTEVITAASRLQLDRLPVLSALTAILSNVISNVPAVIVLRPFADSVHDRSTSVADGRDGLDLGRQSDRHRLDRQSDRGAARGGQRCGDRVVGLLSGRRAANRADPADRNLLAVDLTQNRPEALRRSRPIAGPGAVVEYHSD